MWTVYSKTWGTLESPRVWHSDRLPGTLAMLDVVRNGKPMRDKLYIPLHDVTLIAPPEVA